MPLVPRYHAFFYDARNNSYHSLGMTVNYTLENFHDFGIIDCRPKIGNKPMPRIVIRNTGIYYHGVPIVVSRFMHWTQYMTVEMVLRHDGWLRVPWDVSDPEEITRTSSAPPPYRSPLIQPRRPSTP